MKSLHNLITRTTRAAIQQDRQMKQVISRIVPAISMTHVIFCRLEAGRVRITVDNATWIAKLRFSERQIVGALREAGLDAVTLSFHVAPAETPVTGAAKPAIKRSSNAAALALIRLAASTTQSEDDANPVDRNPSTMTEEGSMHSPEDNRTTAARSDTQVKTSVVRHGEDRLRQELLKLAAKLREER